MQGYEIRVAPDLTLDCDMKRPASMTTNVFATHIRQMAMAQSTHDVFCCALKIQNDRVTLLRVPTEALRVLLFEIPHDVDVYIQIDKELASQTASVVISTTPIGAKFCREELDERC